jgi:proteasome accessory factor C
MTGCVTAEIACSVGHWRSAHGSKASFTLGARLINLSLMAKKTSKKSSSKEASIIPQAKMLRVFRLIALLKSGHWTIEQLVRRMDMNQRTIYRYLVLLEALEFNVEKDFHNKYFIFTSEDQNAGTQFSIDETHLLGQLIQSGIRKNPLKSSLLKKLSLNSELDAMPGLILKTRNARMVEILSSAMKEKMQVILKSYHSANSSDVRDRLIEPIAFGDDYLTVLALDTHDKKCKQFKLDRIGEVFQHTQSFQFEKYHQKDTPDMFGMTGGTTTMVTLKLKMRAYLLLREEFPMAIPFLEKLEDEQYPYQFHGPVKNFEGVARFVMGLSDEVSVPGPQDLIKLIKHRLKNQVLIYVECD